MKTEIQKFLMASAVWGAAMLATTAAKANGHPAGYDIIAQGKVVTVQADGQKRELCISFTDQVWDAESEPSSSPRPTRAVLVKDLESGKTCESYLDHNSGHLKSCDKAFLIPNRDGAYDAFLASGLAGRVSGDLVEYVTSGRPRLAGAFRMQAVGSCQ